MKNLLFVSASLRGGGAERVAVELVNAACDAGFNATFFVGCYEGPYIELVSPKANIVVGGHRRFSRSLFKLSREIRKGNYDYIFCSQQYVVTIAYVALCLSGKKGQTKLLAREASTPSKVSVLKSGIKGRVFRVLFRFVYSGVDRLIAPSENVMTDMKVFYDLNRDIKVINNPINRDEIINKSQLNEQVGLNLTNRYIVAVGRLIENKGVHTIIKALSRSGVSDVDLVVLGDGEYIEELKLLASNLDLTNRVHFLGFLVNPFPVISNAELFVMGSKFEGMPNVLLQASILGIPCLSTPNTGIVHELVDKEFIFPYEDDVALSSLLINVFDEGKLPKNKEFEFMSPEKFLSEVLD
ncbi:hypothetical protein JL49_20755 [Pseudoalteromonas luteoviolacea]|nr:hypothetical protein JL49_20755 [Pseudoalteromonas luteoviolacea]